MSRYLYILLIALMASVSSVDSYAQIDRKDVRKGNREFRKEEYREAEIDYRKALVKDSASVAANYNLAGALYRLNDMEQAEKAMARIKESASTSSYAADYYYNLGDIAIGMKDWQGAVDAFEQSLLLEPSDMAAKENYVYAKKMLQNQQDQNQQNKDQSQDQQDNQQNQNDQNQDQQDNQDQNDRQQDQQDNQDQQDKGDQQQDQQPKITPQAAQQLLQAIQAKEKETQDKVNKEKAQALKSRQKEKNW